MASDNQHIRKFLSYYGHLSISPEYAVLIKGLWGTGKTWFIQDCLKKLQIEGQEHLYISLYGVTSVDDIESEFFRLLHPWLSSKTVNLIGKLAKGFLKATIKFDIDSDGKPDGTLTIGVPNEKLFKSLNSAENKMIVFDDVERCAIPICHLLGYINKFVEHCGFKVILVANENEIIEREKKDESNLNAYRRIKEKLIGKTFEIVPEIEPALSHFAAQLQSDKAKTAIDENKQLLTQLYYSSSYKNLRILRHALLDFDRLFGNFTDDIVSNKAVVSNFLTFYLIYFFEIMSGTISAGEISNLKVAYFSLMRKQKEESNPLQKYMDITSKYTGVSFLDSILQESLWQSWFDKGFVASEEIETAIRNSKYFRSETQFSWVKLWHGEDLSDCDFEEVLKNVDSEWRAKTYIEIGVIKHVAGLLLWLSDIGLYWESKDQILAFSRQYVDFLKEQGHLLSCKPEQVGLIDDESWGGLGYRSIKDADFQEFLKYISRKKEEALLESYASEAVSLLKLMKNETDKFFRTLILSNHEDNRFYEVPILTYVRPNDFVKIFLELIPDQRRIVAYVFKERYKFSGFNTILARELVFLKEIKVLLEKEAATRKGKMSGHTIGLVVDRYLNNAITRLEKQAPDG
jgi:hypothetical protein